MILSFIPVNISAKENKVFTKKNIFLTGIAILNPAISVGTFVSSSGALQKIISFTNITYSSYKGKSIAEEALSKSTKKNCLIENLAKNKNFCI